MNDKKLITTYLDGLILIRDIAIGKELHKLYDHTDRIHQLEITQDVKKMITSSYDKTTRI